MDLPPVAQLERELAMSLINLIEVLEDTNELPPELAEQRTSAQKCLAGPFNIPPVFFQMELPGGIIDKVSTFLPPIGGPWRPRHQDDPWPILMATVMACSNQQQQ